MLAIAICSECPHRAAAEGHMLVHSTGPLTAMGMMAPGAGQCRCPLYSQSCAFPTVLRGDIDNQRARTLEMPEVSNSSFSHSDL